VSKSSQGSIPENWLEAYDTGIYYDPPRPSIPLDPATFGHDTVAAATRRFSLEGKLEEAEQLARNILTRYTDAQGNPLPPSKKEGIPHNVKRQVDFAVMLLGHIRMVQENVDVANVRGAALCGYYVGMYYEALRVSPFENVALRGRKVGKGAHDGGKARAMKSEIVAVWKARAAELWSEDPDMSDLKVAQIIESKFRGTAFAGKERTIRAKAREERWRDTLLKCVS